MITMGILFSGLKAAKKIAGTALSKNTAIRTASWTGIGGVTGLATSDADSTQGKFLDTLRGATIGGMGSLGIKAGATIGKAGIKGSRSLVSNQGLNKIRNLRNPIGPRMEHGGFPSKLGPRTLAETQARSYNYQIGQIPILKRSKQLGNMAMKVGGFVASNPIKTAGLVGATALAMNPPGTAYGNMQYNENSPTLEGAEVDARYNQQELAVDNMESGSSPMGQYGSSPQMNKRWRKAMQQSTEGLVQGLHNGRHG